MRFKLDENLPASLKSIVAADGHDCDTAADEGLSGTDDATVYARSQAEARVLITLDLDFADIRAYPPSQGHGVIVLRPDREDVVSLRRLVERAIKLLPHEPLEARLWIVNERRVRIRE